MKQRKANTRRLTQLALLLALVLIMSYTPLGYLPVGPLTLSLLTIPVAIGAMLLGPAAGAVLGGAFGLTSFFNALRDHSLPDDASLAGTSYFSSETLDDHLPRLLECHRRDGDLVVVMEWVPGQTLAACVGEGKGPSARLELADVVADKRDDIGECTEDISRQQESAAIWSIIDELPDKQGDIIKERYIRNATFEETAGALGISKSRVFTQEMKAMRALKSPAYAKRLLPFYDGVRNRAMHGTGVKRFNETWTSATEREALRLYRYL